MAQMGRLPNISADEAAYYAAQPLWLVISTDIATVAPFAAGVMLLLHSRLAVWFFAVSLALILVNNVYELVAGTSRALVNQGAMIVTIDHRRDRHPAARLLERYEEARRAELSRHSWRNATSASALEAR